MHPENSKFRGLPGTCHNIVLLTDGVKVLEANRPFYRFFGVDSPAAFHRRYGSLAEVFEKVDAYGYLHPTEDDTWLEPLKRGEKKRYRARLRGSEESRVFAVEMSEVREEGSTRYILYLTDITDIEEYKFRLRYSNHRLQEYMKNLNAADIVTRTDPKGIITYANDKFLEVTGYTREEVIGKNHRIVRHPDMPASLFKELWETILSGNIWQGQITNRRKDGSRYIVDATIGPILDTRGEIVEFIGIRHDVTELVEARERAERAELAKTLFFANLSHEIRTPLNAILGFTSLLRHRRDLPDDVRRMIGIIDESGSSLLQIVNDILDLSKFEQGHLSVEPRPVSLEKVVSRTAALFEAKAQEKGVMLRTEIDPQLQDREVHTDPHRLRQVLSNLISNGVKFTDSGGEVLLRVRCLGKEGGKTRVRFEVVDDGIGIAPEVQERIFRPFEQADRSTERKYGGTGLGLPICARIVEAMGGDLRLESREGEGSRFFFDLEFDVVQEEEDHRGTGESDGGETRFYGEVLLAEDLPFNQELIRAFLQRYGVEDLDVVDNGNAALERIRSRRYDLVFLDIEMPGMRGDEVLRNWRSEEEDLDIRQRIVALTAHADEESLKYFLGIGFDEVVAKPVTADSLKQILSRYLRMQEHGDYMEKAQGSDEERRAFHREMAELFFSGADEEVAALELLARQKKWVELTMAAQKLQASASGIGLQSIAHLASELARQATRLATEGGEDGTEELLQRLREEIDRIRP